MTKTSQWPVPADSIRYVIPRPVIKALASHPLTRDLYPLAFGHYRRAAGHHMHREHHDDHLLIYCTEGGAYLSIDDEPCMVKAGDLVLLPAGAAHRYTAAPDHPWSIHWVHYTGPLAADFRDHMGFTEGVNLLHLGRQPRLLVDFSGLLAVRQTGFRTAGLVHVANRLRQLLAAIPLSAGEAAVAHQPDLDTIHAYMREHLKERITLGQLAELAGQSPAHFATRYRTLTGVSPIQHFLHLKVEQACQMLDSSELSFTQISSDLGYDDNYYFSRLFKKVMGQSPTEYRHTRRH
ncbi:AraC family transcriptional regulator [Marinobacter salicampi]|uniref:AraC family transcriptional regulator n=1 Tax=Marinobacter salicampi TaxID=435907 RepID=UPI00140E84D1|nr:AraC family transcriptional regulator [Marinobacter salicampi]